MIVQTQAGWVEGFTENDIPTFLGIPYAAPITEENRFFAPQPVAPWQGIRSAKMFSPVCPQYPTYGPVGCAATSHLRVGHDFLTVNVRTPSLTGNAPVLVWIHGGGYAVGSANEPLLQTGAFAASGIVEVSVNYRLGALGFMHLGGEFPDNRGLLDQIAALRWVQNNIAAFGGDPRRVTFSGRSAGGFSVAAVMAMPDAEGLFSQVLLQSGASTAVSSREDAQKVTARMLSALDIKADDLSTLPIERLLLAQKAVCDESYNHHDYERDGGVTALGVPFVPVINAISLPHHPEQAAEIGLVARVPMMIGCTTGEYVTHSKMYSELTFADAEQRLDPRVRPFGLRGVEIIQRYRRHLPNYTALGLWRAIGGDMVFQNPSTRFAQYHSRYQPVYKYLYGTIEDDGHGAPHGAEAGHVWYRDRSNLSHLSAHQRITDAEFARTLHRLWSSFIHHQSPACGGVNWLAFSETTPVVLRLTPEKIWHEDDPFTPRIHWWKTE
ncbi:carboxylesterase/lipase family protein [Pectobacterium wasabiae]|uniref:Carboxylesterase n=1 Tax=Pectobacterium wasabiae TaxID=55208 RepID=A0AAW3EIZ6_9GAMM|nr:carboxylesterase family protein [Pectobacterium wasabiae]AOR64107.1 carboxylesterase [Pectobacterium wasabiae CFBP 3304]EJS94506.1 Carboxylesterase type B-like protein [Pectobacterium wasabiae CFBP 3304]KFX08727.1 carboxylesterase [Pectobacterium wasabiae]KGA28754.1 carboxylesterase [Pectobacterium wasabiae]